MTAIQDVVRCATDYVRWSFVHYMGVTERGYRARTAD